MLYFVGTGIGGFTGLTLQSVNILKKCDIIYVERFTSPLDKQDLQNLASIVGKNIDPVERWFVEDGRQILEQARQQNVALVTYGDPMIATTHNELRIRAARNSIGSKILHSASGIYSIIGETGLHAYKFGKTVTIMSESQSTVSVYNVVLDNLLLGNHTMILTEYNQCKGQVKAEFFLDPSEAFRMLLEEEQNQRQGAISQDTFAVVASRIGSEGQRIVSGRVKSLSKTSFGQGPHSIIVTGRLHFTESDSLAVLTESFDAPSDNSLLVTRSSVRMIEKYSPRTRQAVERMRDILREEGVDDSKKGMLEILDNAECYVIDAERFLQQGKFDLAVLSIGYAEGLVDALRFQKGIDPWK
jgi:diphthine synthase